MSLLQACVLSDFFQPFFMDEFFEKQIAVKATKDGIVIQVFATDDDLENPVVGLGRFDQHGHYTLRVGMHDLLDVLAAADKKLATVGVEIAS